MVIPEVAVKNDDPLITSQLQPKLLGWQHQITPLVIKTRLTAQSSSFSDYLLLSQLIMLSSNTTYTYRGSSVPLSPSSDDSNSWTGDTSSYDW